MPIQLYEIVIYESLALEFCNTTKELFDKLNKNQLSKNLLDKN